MLSLTCPTGARLHSLVSHCWYAYMQRSNKIPNKSTFGTSLTSVILSNMYMFVPSYAGIWLGVPQARHSTSHSTIKLIIIKLVKLKPCKCPVLDNGSIEINMAAVVFCIVYICSCKLIKLITELNCTEMMSWMWFFSASSLKGHND